MRIVFLQDRCGDFDNNACSILCQLVGLQNSIVFSAQTNLTASCNFPFRTRCQCRNMDCGRRYFYSFGCIIISLLNMIIVASPIYLAGPFSIIYLINNIILNLWFRQVILKLPYDNYAFWGGSGMYCHLCVIPCSNWKLHICH